MDHRDINFLRFATLKLPLGHVDMFSGALLRPTTSEQVHADIDRFLLREYRSYSPVLSLYIHIPFCAGSCLYCCCRRRPIVKRVEVVAYCRYLSYMMKQFSPQLKDVGLDICNFGGGTPSLLSSGQIAEIFGMIRECFRIQEDTFFMFEGSPSTLTFDKLKALKTAGVSRITLGVQTLDKKVLREISRSQDKAGVARCVEQIKRLGFSFLNIDLMTGLPFQTEESFLSDLLFTISLEPEVIHVHPFWNIQDSQYYRQKEVDINSLLRARHSMTLAGRGLLLNHGYQRVGQEGFQRSRGGEHEQALLYERSVGATLGLGAYAVSVFPGQSVMRCMPRSEDMTDNEYHRYLYSKKTVMANFVITNILSGLGKEHFRKIFGEDLVQVFGEKLQGLVASGMVAYQGESLVYLGPRTFRNLFDLFSYLKLLYDDDLLENLWAAYQGQYRRSTDYSADRHILNVMDKGWFVQGVYDLGI